MLQKQISKYFAVRSLMHIVMVLALSLSLIWQGGCASSGVQKEGSLSLSKGGTPLKDDGFKKLSKKGVKKIILKTLLSDDFPDKERGNSRV